MLPQAVPEGGWASARVEEPGRGHLAWSNLAYQVGSHLLANGQTMTVETRMMLAQIRDLSEAMSEETRSALLHTTAPPAAPAAAAGTRPGLRRLALVAGLFLCASAGPVAEAPLPAALRAPVQAEPAEPAVPLAPAPPPLAPAAVAPAPAEPAAPPSVLLAPPAAPNPLYAPAEETALALTRAERAEIQTRLRLAGFGQRRSDGVFGPRTRAALAAWQARRGLPVTGHLDEAARARLVAETEEPFARARAAARRTGPRTAEPPEPAPREDAGACPRDATGRTIYFKGFTCDLEALREELFGMTRPAAPPPPDRD